MVPFLFFFFPVLSIAVELFLLELVTELTAFEGIVVSLFAVQNENKKLVYVS